MPEGRVSYKYIGRKERSRGHYHKNYVNLVTDEPERIYVRKIRKEISESGNLYYVIDCDGNRELVLKGVRAKSFEEKVPNEKEIRYKWIEITQREHVSSRGRKYYTVDVKIGLK